MVRSDHGQADFGPARTIPRTTSIFPVSVYVAGFLIINAHLGKHGILDFEVASLHYLRAGGLYVAFWAFWYFGVGREIQVILRMGECGSAVSRSENVWEDVISLPRLCFVNCVSAALFSTVLLGNLEAWDSWHVFTLILIVGLPIFVDHDRVPRLGFLIELGAPALGILVFFITAIAADNQAMYVFLHSAALSVFVYLFQSNKLAHIFRYAVLVFVSAPLFGAVNYGYIPSAFGGGQLRPVEIMISDQPVRDRLENLGFKTTPFLEAKLVHENQREFFIDVDGQTIRLSKNTVSALKMLPSEEGHWLLRHLTGA